MSLDIHRFNDMLKRIGYPDANKLETADFLWMFEDKDLKPFFEAICNDVTSENVLTPEEVEEYEKLQAAIKADPILAKRIELLSDAYTNENEEDTINELEENVAGAERHVRSLEHQISIMNEEKRRLEKNYNKSERSRREYRQEMRTLQNEVIPAAIEEVQNAIQKGILVAKQCHEQMSQNPAESIKPLFMNNLTEYLESEQEMLDKLAKFLNTDFQQFVADGASQKVNPNRAGFIPELPPEEAQNKSMIELQKLQETLQKLEHYYIKNFLEFTKEEEEVRHNKQITKNIMLYNLHGEQLLANLEKAKTLLKLHQETEAELLSKVEKAVKHKAQMQCEYVVFLNKQKKAARYENFQKLLEKPLELLLNQRARLELLYLCLNVQEFNLGEMHKTVVSFRSNVEKEVATYNKQCCEENSNKMALNKMKEGHIFQAIKNILCEVSSEKLLFFTCQDVLQRVDKLFEESERQSSSANVLLAKQLASIKLLDRSMSVLEENIFDVHLRDANHPQHLLDLLSSSLSKFSGQILNFEEKLLEKMSEYKKKTKILLRNNHLKKARYLFVYAVTNQEKFLDVVKEIEAELEHSSNI